MIYFAGSLFNDAERAFNLELSHLVEKAGFVVFLPQRDGVEANKFPYNEMTQEERRRAMFDLDRDKIIESEIFLFSLDGRVPDEGACVELGIAYTHRFVTGCNRFIVGIQTDCRSAFMNSRLNPMLKMAFDIVVEDKETLLSALCSYRNASLNNG